jgi:Baseplate J-like protein
MATIVYLDVEDEITTAATRIRHAAEARVGVVVPFGSRVATSRINFRLLAREADDAGRELDVIAPDASARALASSAGLTVFASVADYQAALEAREASPAHPEEPARPSSSLRSPGGAEPGAVRKAGSSGGPRSGPPRPAETTGPDGAISAPGRSAAASSRVVRDAPVDRGSSRGVRRLVLALVLLLAVVIGFGGAAAALTLPSAVITITPVMEAVAPVEFTVRADPAAAGVDQANLVIPATTVDVPLSVQGTFQATGTSVTQTAATGHVTFDSINTVNAMPIAQGTRVSTLGGITFATTASVVVPRATVSGTTIAHGTVTVTVKAVSQGPSGNVPANDIDQVPSSLAAQQISVYNTAPTSGGQRTETPKILASDVTAAADKLAKDLADQMTASLADPTLAPDGATLYPETAKLGEPTYTPDSASLEGQVLKAGESTFTLQAAADATVTAVNESPLRGMGEAAISAAVASGYEIVPGSIDVSVSRGAVVEDGTVSYSVTASALEQRPLDAAALKADVLGKGPVEAQAALSRYGKVDVSLSPFWVTTVPDNPDKVTLTIAAPERPAASAGPSSSGLPASSAPTASEGPPSSAPVNSAPGSPPVPSG